MRNRVLLAVAVALVLAAGGAARAQHEFSATLSGTGHDERVDGGPGCPQEADFMVGVYDGVAQLQAGGNGYGCASEWGAFAEFDFAPVGTGVLVEAATLRLRYTGYGDDAQGLPYLAVYGYACADGPVALPRDELDDRTALAVFAPTSVTNVDIVIDVTDHVTALAADGIFRAGFLVCGVFPEVGYNDLVFFGGASSAAPPRLDLAVTAPVSLRSGTWGAVKSLFNDGTRIP